MNSKKILLAALAGAAFTAAHAEDGNPDARAARSEARAMLRQGEMAQARAQAQAQAMVAGMRFAGPLMRMRAEPVKNAPFSAEVLSEQQQHLADGNQIAHQSSSMSYRDSAGRTRQEVRDGKGEVRSVTIHDARSGITYLLKPRERSATRIGAGQADARAAGEAAHAAARARVEQMRKGGTAGAAEGGPGGEEIILTRVQRANGEAGRHIRENVRIHAGGDGAAAQHIGPLIANAFGDVKWSSRGVSKDLGTREFEGVKAEGRLRSYEIPAGAVGNRNPITVSDETWFAPALQVTVYAKHSDPRSGERVYRLTGIRRDEPAASLFSVPADYSVKDVPARMRMNPPDGK